MKAFADSTRLKVSAMQLIAGVKKKPASKEEKKELLSPTEEDDLVDAQVSYVPLSIRALQTLGNLLFSCLPKSKKFKKEKAIAKIQASLVKLHSKEKQLVSQLRIIQSKLDKELSVLKKNKKKSKATALKLIKSKKRLIHRIDQITNNIQALEDAQSTIEDTDLTQDMVDSLRVLHNKTNKKKLTKLTKKVEQTQDLQDEFIDDKADLDDALTNLFDQNNDDNFEDELNALLDSDNEELDIPDLPVAPSTDINTEIEKEQVPSEVFL